MARSKKDSIPSSSESVSGSPPRGRPKKSTLQSALSTIQVNDKDVVKWMRLVELRGSSNELYRMADRFQANLIITGIITIQEIYKTVANGIGDDVSLDQLNKLTTSFNRAVASINQALSYLGVTGNNREDEPETDSLGEFLKNTNLELEVAPVLQIEYLSVQKEMAGMEIGGGVVDTSNPALGILSEERKTILAKLKEPMKSFSEDEVEVVGKDEKVIDVELERGSVL